MISDKEDITIHIEDQINHNNNIHNSDEKMEFSFIYLVFVVLVIIHLF
jgi:hypothetical protein